ncbi:MAG: hypothetical protein EON88_09090 [Brevundimonas sp.]|nr:MAG: hypothetical protein EON88_09695 [Brevundimonas sp.]RZJ95891.1 MAG: hypothetical protein EON88_09090 [Brevundimonas sp.]
MGLLNNLLFAQTGLGNAYADPHTIYRDVLGDGGALGGATSLNLDQVGEALVGSGGVVDELFAGDALGVNHLLAEDTLIGGIVADIDPFG